MAGAGKRALEESGVEILQIAASCRQQAQAALHWDGFPDDVDCGHNWNGTLQALRGCTIPANTLYIIQNQIQNQRGFQFIVTRFIDITQHFLNDEGTIKVKIESYKRMNKIRFNNNELNNQAINETNDTFILYDL